MMDEVKNTTEMTIIFRRFNAIGESLSIVNK